MRNKKIKAWAIVSGIGKIPNIFLSKQEAESICSLYNSLVKLNHYYKIIPCKIKLLSLNKKKIIK